jgi:hypothetical protein
MLKRNTLVLKQGKVQLRENDRIEKNGKWVPALSVPMHLGLLGRPYVPHNLLSMSWEPCSFTTVPDCPQTWTYNIRWVQEKGAQMGVSE